MIRSICLLIILHFAIAARSQEIKIDLEYVRANFDKALNNKQLCSELIEGLESKKSEAIFVAYLGGLQTIWANHVFNPLSKYNTFKKGKDNIEKAVAKDDKNTEIRFIRLSVQKNAPSFLGYNKNIKEDELFLKSKKDLLPPELSKKLKSILEN